MMDTIHLFDRSRVTTDWSCRRKRYWQYEHDGKGVVANSTGIELFMGSTIHDALAGIATQHLDNSSVVDIDRIAGLAHDQMVQTLSAESAGEVENINFANEQAALVEGLVRGFYKHVWPNLMLRYPKILMIEQEMEFKHDGMIFMSRPDLVLEDTEGELWYVEYKSTSSKKEGWVNSWGTAIQLHSTVKAIEQTVGRPVMGVIVQGLYKGYESYGKQTSPFCYAYRRNGNPPFSKDEISYEYKAGFKKYPVWELSGGVKEWVEKMPLNVLQDQFPQCPPIYVKQEMVDNFFRQQMFREKEIQMAMGMLKVNPAGLKDVLDVSFPQTFSECQPAWGHACQYRRLCHGPEVDPLTAGFEYRVPHHDLEVQQQHPFAVSSCNGEG